MQKSDLPNQETDISQPAVLQHRFGQHHFRFALAVLSSALGVSQPGKSRLI